MRETRTLETATAAAIIVAIGLGGPVALTARAAEYVVIDLGTLGGGESSACALNHKGQIVGYDYNPNPCCRDRAFRTSPHKPINAATDDLGTHGGDNSNANAINDSGQVVGTASVAGNTTRHAFRTAPNSPINPLRDDLGTFGGEDSFARGINKSG